MTITEKIRLEAACGVFLRLCEKTDCEHCPITLFFHHWEICPVEMLAAVLNQAENPERSFLTCKHAVKGKPWGVEYCDVKCVPEMCCNCATCESFEPREETK